MTEREKVIKGLEYHLKELTVGKTCYECPYLGDNPCEIQLIANAIALLKDAEPREWIYCEDDSGQDGYRCSGCGFFEPWYYNSAQAVEQQ